MKKNLIYKNLLRLYKIKNEKANLIICNYTSFPVAKECSPLLRLTRAAHGNCVYGSHFTICREPDRKSIALVDTI